ncbi:MAG: hypothetical protein A2161_02245 [Candidatus Schekmanbacteria bacterium RBG_13_48_7]|uniref:Uncharacterized protein n=1 Tax=Candidatus Schekmanbacteria bacterium RBG_13_48_7 TaxID=1817878 RepID=A0A1F7RQX5_9BACT|nr:MAG: hypothetical protein A2161_02245 [Candidatus Schekmanbacteria bacterium RBG_13_48_7]
MILKNRSRAMLPRQDDKNQLLPSLVFQSRRSNDLLDPALLAKLLKLGKLISFLILVEQHEDHLLKFPLIQVVK